MTPAGLHSLEQDAGSENESRVKVCSVCGHVLHIFAFAARRRGGKNCAGGQQSDDHTRLPQTANLRRMRGVAYTCAAHPGITAGQTPIVAG